MKISELILAIKEDNLSKEQLESYHQQLTCLFAEMELKMADLEKEEALYLANCQEPTKANAQRKFNVTESGLALIELKHKIRAIEKLASSVKHRVYNYL